MHINNNNVGHKKYNNRKRNEAKNNRKMLLHFKYLPFFVYEPNELQEAKTILHKINEHKKKETCRRNLMNFF